MLRPLVPIALVLSLLCFFAPSCSASRVYWIRGVALIGSLASRRAALDGVVGGSYARLGSHWGYCGSCGAVFYDQLSSNVSCSSTSGSSFSTCLACETILQGCTAWDPSIASNRVSH